MNIEEKMIPIDEWNKQFSCKYMQQPISFLTEENLDRLQQHCEKAIQYESGRILEEHQVTLELIIRYNELKTDLEKEKKKNKELEKENKKLNILRLELLISQFPDTTETYKKYKKELDEAISNLKEE